MSVIAWLYNNMSKNKPNALMTHEACESKLRLVVRSSMHPYPGKWVAIGHVVVYHAWAARELMHGLNVGTVSFTLERLVLGTPHGAYPPGLLNGVK